MAATFPLVFGGASTFWFYFDQAQELEYDALGEVSISGSSVATLRFVRSSTGALTLDGSATYEAADGYYVAYASDGTVTLAGSSIYNNGSSFLYQGSGGITLTGSADYELLPLHSYLGSGSITLTGSSVTSSSDTRRMDFSKTTNSLYVPLAF